MNRKKWRAARIAWLICAGLMAAMTVACLAVAVTGSLEGNWWLATVSCASACGTCWICVRMAGDAA